MYTLPYNVTKILKWDGDGNRALFSDSTLHNFIIQSSVSSLLYKKTDI
jgi:hypothetical protein